jgi:hypothetical protein
MRVDRHWWNGDTSVRGRRDVFIRTDGQVWEVEARVGGGGGRSKTHSSLGQPSAEILAGAWMAGNGQWRLVKS